MGRQRDPARQTGERRRPPHLPRGSRAPSSSPGASQEPRRRLGRRQLQPRLKVCRATLNHEGALPSHNVRRTRERRRSEACVSHSRSSSSHYRDPHTSTLHTNWEERRRRRRRRQKPHLRRTSPKACRRSTASAEGRRPGPVSYLGGRKSRHLGDTPQLLRVYVSGRSPVPPPRTQWPADGASFSSPEITIILITSSHVARITTQTKKNKKTHKMKERSCVINTIHPSNSED